MKTKKIVSALLTFVMLLSFVLTFNLTAFAENDNIDLTVNIKPLKISKSITISENAKYTDLKSKIEEEVNINFNNDGYGIYCPEARIYYHPSSGFYKIDETKTLKDLNFKSGYTVNLEKLSWTGTTDNPIKCMGLEISGGVGACETFRSGTSAVVDYDWNYSLKYITIRTETPITISGTAEDGVHIIINTGSSVWGDLTIKDVTMTAEKSACITLSAQAQLNLTLAGTNKLTSRPGVEYGNSKNAPAIELCQSNSYLKIDGNGSLTAESTCEGYPGIGTKNDDVNVKGVEINGGTIVSTGGTNGVGIRAKRIWIYGGDVTANGGLSAKSAFKIENAIVTAISDTQVFKGTLKPTIKECNAVASVNKDGTETEKYDATKSNTYKYFKVTPKAEAPLTVDKPQEYIYDGTVKAFKLPENILDGFSVAYKQGGNDVTAPTNAGKYDVIITRAEDDTYKSYSKTIENGLVIKPKTVDENIVLTAPVKNAIPQTIIETEEYTATVSWSPEIADGSTFANSTEYTATITITLKDTTNYTFEGINENGYKLNGATSITNEADSNVITAVFSQTAGNSGSGGTTRYTVTFVTNGGSNVSSQKVVRKNTVKEPAEPTKKDCIFEGWYSDKTLTGKYDFSEKVLGNITLYAKWNETENEDSKENNVIVLTINEKTAVVFGKKVENDVAPVIRNERTMLPSRFVAESLGAIVEWNEELQQVTITKDDITIIITIGADKALVNGEEITMDSPAFIENGRTYTPIRFICEELGATVEWNEDAQTVTITK